MKSRYTDKQGQYLAFIYYYTKILGHPPAEADMQRYCEAVLVWGLAQRPSAVVSQVVVQDEFTHDVVLPLRDCWLVYETT